MTSVSTAPILGRVALVVLCGTILVSVMNASMTTVALPDLQADFHVATDELAWVVTAYLIPFATGTVVYGRLADMWGTRRVYIVGLALFAFASLGVGLAPSFPLVVAMRVLQGMGGTSVPSLSMATIVRTTSLAQRGRAMGATMLAVGIGFGVGPLVGGSLTEWAGWRAPFFFTAAATALLLPVALRTAPPVPGWPGQRFDYVGAVLLTGAVTGDIIALNRLPRSITDPAGLTGAIASAPLWALLAWRTVAATQPFIHRKVATNARFLFLTTVGLTIQGGHFAVIVLIPLLLADRHGMSIIRIGFHLLPGALALAVFGMAGGRLVNRLGNQPLLVAGTWLVFVAAVAFHLAGVDWNPVGISLIYVLFASGYGMVNATAVTAATGELPADLSGTGVGVFNLGFFLGGAITVAIAGAILRARASAAVAIDPFFTGRAVDYSDAMLPVVAFTLLGFLLAVVVTSSRKARPAPSRVEDWALKPRQKPNAPPARAK